MAGLASINIKFSADLKGFSTAMQNSSRKIEKFGKQMQSVGQNLTIGLTAPLVAFGAVALKNFDKQDKAVAQLNAGLKSSGRFTDELSDKLQKQASELQNNSLFGDEDILANATAQILTFTNISVDKIAEVNLASANLATRLGTDLKSASIQLGKALNDPITNLSALSRSGIQFSEDQKAMIKSLVETNRIGEAQTLILAELETQYGNSAKAASLAGLGGLKQLSNSFGDLTEDIGGIIAGAILPFVDTIKGLVTSFQNLSPETKKWIVILGGVGAAIGPILALAGTILPAVLAGFGFLISPIGLIIAGLTTVGVIIYKNWAPIKAQLVNIANYFIDLYNESTGFRIAVEAVVLTFKSLWSVGKFVLSGIGSLLSNLGEAFVLNVDIMGKALKAVLTNPLSAADALKDLFSDLAKGAITTFAKTSASLNNDWQNLLGNLNTNTKEAFDNISKRAKIKLLKENVDTDALSDITTTIPEIKIPVSLVPKTITSSANKPTEAQLGEMTKVDAQEVVENSSGPLSFEDWKKELLTFEQRLESFSINVSEIMSSAAKGALEGLGVMIAGLATGNLTLGDVAGNLLRIIGDMATSLGKAAIELGVGMLAVKAAFTNPFAAIAAGVGLIALGAIISSTANITSGKDAGAFANGGIVGGSSFVGDKLFARVNSREMILNEPQQRNMLGLIGAGNSQPVNVTLQPSIDFVGDKFRVMLNKVDKRNFRKK